MASPQPCPKMWGLELVPRTTRGALTSYWKLCVEGLKAKQVQSGTGLHGCPISQSTQELMNRFGDRAVLA